MARQPRSGLRSTWRSEDAGDRSGTARDAPSAEPGRVRRWEPISLSHKSAGRASRSPAVGCLARRVAGGQTAQGSLQRRHRSARFVYGRLFLVDLRGGTRGLPKGRLHGSGLCVLGGRRVLWRGPRRLPGRRGQPRRRRSRDCYEVKHLHRDLAEWSRGEALPPGEAPSGRKPQGAGRDLRAGSLLHRHRSTPCHDPGGGRGPPERAGCAPPSALGRSLPQSPDRSPPPWVAWKTRSSSRRLGERATERSSGGSSIRAISRPTVAMIRRRISPSATSSRSGPAGIESRWTDSSVGRLS